MGNKQTAIPLTDGSGRWFDVDRAQVFEEDRWHDGSSMISRATGSQWEHETLYLTATGKWVLHWWSQREGSRASVLEITKAEAAAWFSRNGYAPHEDVADEFAELEV